MPTPQTILSAISVLALTGCTLGQARVAGDPAVQSYMDCWKLWNEDWKQLASCYDDAIVSDEPGSPGQKPWIGKAAVMGHVELFKHVFPDAKGELQLVVVNGERSAGIALISGTHDGDMRQPGGVIEPTHKPLGLFVGHQLLRGASGKSVSELIFIDHAALWGQLGRYPGPHRDVARSGRPSPEIVVAKHDEKERRNLDAFRRAVAALNAHDADAFAGVLADDVVLSNHALPGDLDKTGAIGFLSALWRGFSNFEVTVAAPWAAGDWVVAEGMLSGVNDGDIPMLGVKRTGRKLALPYLEFARYRDGKVVATWVFYDGLGFAHQLGLGQPGG